MVDKEYVDRGSPWWEDEIYVMNQFSALVSAVEDHARAMERLAIAMEKANTLR